MNRYGKALWVILILVGQIGHGVELGHNSTQNYQFYDCDEYLANQNSVITGCSFMDAMWQHRGYEVTVTKNAYQSCLPST